MIVQLLPILEEIGGERADIPRLSLAETEGVHQKFILAADATDADVFPAQLTTIDVLAIKVDGGITFKANSSATAQTLDANGVLIWFGTAITALTLTEPNTATVNVEMWAWGA